MQQHDFSFRYFQLANKHAIRTLAEMAATVLQWIMVIINVTVPKDTKGRCVMVSKGNEY